MATAYLIELLDGRIGECCDPSEEETLAEAMLTARTEAGSERIRRMRDLGDRALFTAGYFADSLNRKVVGLDYYRQIGSSAYGDVASVLGGRGGTWRRLYSELSHRFGEFTDVLMEVGDRSRMSQPDQLLKLYERYLDTGSYRDRTRLVRLGHLPVSPKESQGWQ
jgi:hypothetical protein